MMSNYRLNGSLLENGCPQLSAHKLAHTNPWECYSVHPQGAVWAGDHHFVHPRCGQKCINKIIYKDLGILKPYLHN